MGRIVFVLCRIVLVSLRLILRIKGYVSVEWGLFCAVFVVFVVGCCWLLVGDWRAGRGCEDGGSAVYYICH